MNASNVLLFEMSSALFRYPSKCTLAVCFVCECLWMFLAWLEPVSEITHGWAAQRDGACLHRGLVLLILHNRDKPMWQELNMD